MNKNFYYNDNYEPKSYKSILYNREKIENTFFKNIYNTENRSHASFSDFSKESKKGFNKSEISFLDEKDLSVDSFENTDESEEGKVYEHINSQVTKQAINNIFDVYMSPQGMDSDYRLGKVLSKVPTANKNNQTDEDGRLFTRSLYDLKLKYNQWNIGSIFEKEDYYSVLWFPPYIYNNVSLKEKAYNNIIDKITSLDNTLLLNKNNQYFPTFDEKTFQAARSSFTYRAPGFKSINDNINMVQWLFEGVTGIVSTYLTEWDLSLYAQESLMKETNNVINLTYGLEAANPSGYDDDRALSWGVLNCAVSKLFGHNTRTWDINSYPQSSWHTEYPFISGNIKEFEKISSPKKTIYVPSSYNIGQEGEDEYIRKYGNNFYSYLKFQDYEGAALSGYKEWDFNDKIWKAIYSIDEDQLSDLDIALLPTSSGLHKKSNLISLIKDKVYNLEELFSEENNGDVSPDEFNELLKDKEKRKNERKKALQSAKTASASATSQFGIGEKSKKSLKLFENSNTVGIPQNNPTLYGGPHGLYRSPESYKGYLEENSIFLRNIPRIFKNKGFEKEPLTSGNFYFNGSEKYYKEKENAQIFEQSISKGISILANGLLTFGYSYGNIIVNNNVTIEKQNNEWPKFYGNTNYELTYTSNPYFIDKAFYERISWSEYWKYYWNKEEFNKYTFEFTSGNGYVGWVKKTIKSIEVRDAYYKSKKYTLYLRPNLHSEPNMNFKIVKTHYFKFSASNSPENSLKYKWNLFWAKLFKITVKSSFANGNVIENYELHCDNGGTFRSKYIQDGKTNQKLELLLTNDEHNIMKNIIDWNGGTGASNKMFFMTRYNNLPDCIFRSKVTHDITPIKYWEKKVKRGPCGKVKEYFIESIGYKHFLKVDLNSCDYFVAGLYKPSFNGKLFSYDLTSQMPPTSGRVPFGFDFFKESDSCMETRKSPFDLFTNISTGRKYPMYNSISKRDEMMSSIKGIEGKGIFGSIPGLLYKGIDSDSEKISDKASSSTLDKLNTPLGNVDFPLWKINYFSNLEKEDEKGRTYLPNYSIPNYSRQNSPIWWNKMIVNLCLRGTFYREDVDDKYYFSSFESIPPFLYNKVSKEISYLKLAKELFCGKIKNSKKYSFSFNFLKGLLEGDSSSPSIISPRTLELSDNKSEFIEDPNGDYFISGKKYSKRKELYGYNYWIKIAKNLFCNNDSKNFEMHKKLETEFTKRILTLELIQSDLLKLINKENLLSYTYNEILSVFSIIEKLNNIEKENDFIENFFLAYLNILYESRRYFINKRCNKQDGTLWTCRHLEASAPQVLSASLSKSNQPNMKSLALNNNKIKVDFYECQNSLKDKSKALEKKSKGENFNLEEDKISYVYVKVKYASKEEYDNCQEKLKSGELKNSDQRIIKVKPWTYIKKRNGEFKNIKNNDILEDGETWDQNGWAIKSGPYKYAVKPKDGKYTFLSKEIKKIIKKKNSQTDKISKDINLTTWQINWSEQVIMYNFYGGVNISALNDLASSGIKDPIALMCGSKEPADYWRIPILCEKPLKENFKSNFTLELLNEEEEGEVSGLLALTALTGPAAYAMWPIIEEQKSIIPNGGDLSSAIDNL